jgi:hypothetical protein
MGEGEPRLRRSEALITSTATVVFLARPAMCVPVTTISSTAWVAAPGAALAGALAAGALSCA